MKFKHITVVSAISLLILSSCELFPFYSGSSDGTSTVNSQSGNGEGYYTPSSYEMNLADVRYETGYVNLESTGEQNILVIPVNFTNATCSALSRGCTTLRSDIQKAFFGESGDTGWESVASFYEKSSYGNLTITGTVTPWFDLDKSTTQLEAMTEYNDPTYYVLREAVDWYKTYSGSTLTEYDSNDDGYLDLVWLVYASDHDANSDLYWAYTFWDYEQESSMTSPVGNVYAWASYDFLWEGAYGTLMSPKVDAHTYIHETGHTMGLDDYYSYDDEDWGAAGGIDMMDYNIADHNAYSKMGLGWTMPYVVDGSANSVTLTLSPFESSGDCIIVKNNWNGSPLDEYLLIEFYTPTGLNEADSLTGGYPGSGARAFSIPGIKIYHIDSRLGRLTYTNPPGFVSFTDTISFNNDYYTDIAVSNTASYNYANENYKLVHLLEASGENTLAEGYMAGDSALFLEGDTFDPSSLMFSGFFVNSGRFNDNTSVGFSIEVDDITLSLATITVTTD